MASAEQRKSAAIALARKACRSPGMLTAAEISLLAGAFLEAVGVNPDQPKALSASGKPKPGSGSRPKTKS